MLPKAVQEMDAAADEALRQFEDAETGTEVLDSILDENKQTPTEETVLGANPAPEPDALDQMTHRYQTLEGKYRAEVPRLHQELREMRAQMDAHTAAPPDLPEPEPFDPVEASKKYLNPQEIEDFDEALGTHARLAQGAAEAAAAASEARWQQYVGQLEDRLAVLEDTAIDGEDAKFWGSVESEVPGAQAINEADPLFVEFLDSIEPKSGHPYRYLGENAISTGDIERTVEIFQAYLSQYGRGAAPTPIEKKAPPVKPETTKTREAPDATTTKVIRKAEIDKFYADYSKGVYENDPEKAKRIEAQIDKAMEEGRIIS